MRFRLRRSAEAPKPTPPKTDLGKIVFTNGATYPVTKIELARGCVCITGTLFARDFPEIMAGASVAHASVEGEYEIFDPKGKSVVLGWTPKTYPAMLSAPDDSFSISIDIGPIGATTGWFRNRS